MTLGLARCFGPPRTKLLNDPDRSYPLLENQLEAFAMADTVKPDAVDTLFEGSNLSLLELLKIQAQVLVPVLRAFRDEFGEERGKHDQTDHV